MANYVYSSIRIMPTNDAGKAKVKEILERATSKPQDDGQIWFGYLFVDGKEGSPSYEDTHQYSWTTDVIGPKWCHIEDHTFDEEDGELHLVTNSAWSAPEPGLVKMLEEIEAVDPKVRATITYEDEMPNFIGAYVFEGSELVDGAEDDDEDIRYMMFHRYPHLKEHWDEDNDEWKCDEDGEMLDESYEAEEEFREMLYEWINERQDELISETLKYLDERDSEDD